MSDEMLRDKAGPFGPKGRQVINQMAALADEWVRHDGGTMEHLPVLFAAALTEALARKCSGFDGSEAARLDITCDEPHY